MKMTEPEIKNIVMDRLDIFEDYMNETAKKNMGLNIRIKKSEEPKKRGRKSKYETDEERREAKLRQTKESNKRMSEKRNEFESQKYPAQIMLSKQLSNTILTEKQTQELIELFNWITEDKEEQK
jgi:hypothetical protein